MKTATNPVTWKNGIYAGSLAIAVLLPVALLALASTRQRARAGLSLPAGTCDYVDIAGSCLLVLGRADEELKGIAAAPLSRASC